MSTYNTFKKSLAGQQNKPNHERDIEEARTHTGVYEAVFGTPVQELDIKDRMRKRFFKNLACFSSCPRQYVRDEF